MKKKILGGLTVLAFICLFTSIVSAQSINLWYVQHRLYEDGRDFYRLCFSLSDCSSGSCVWILDNIVDKVEVFQSSDGVNWTSIGIYTTASGAIFPSDERYSFENYDTNVPRWNYALDNNGHLIFYHEYYYNVNLTQIPAIPAYFKIDVYIINGQNNPIEPPNLFHLTPETLPMIKGKSIKSSWDKDGNWIITWDPPYTYEPSPMYDHNGNFIGYRTTSTRLFIYLVDAKPDLYYFLGRVPTHMGYLFVPKDIVDQLKEWQEELATERHEKNKHRVGLQLQVRTNDNSNRTYSVEQTVKLK